MYYCQDMEKSIWDLSTEVIYTTSVFKSDTPLSVIASGLVWCGGGVVAALVVYIGIFLPIDNLSSK